MIKIDLENGIGLSFGGDVINLLDEYFEITQYIYALMLNESKNNRKIFDERIQQAKIDSMKIDKSIFKRAKTVKPLKPKDLTLEELNEIVKNSGKRGTF